MPRGSRAVSATGIYHWIARGVNQKTLFHRPDDYKRFLDLAGEYKAALRIKIYHYCLMGNHVHFLLLAADISALSSFSYYVLRRYAYHYCGAYAWKGQVFQRMYKSLPIENESYLLECGRYIEQNPLRAGLVDRPEDYPYSSFRFYAHANENGVLDESPAFLMLSEAMDERRRIYSDYINQARPYESILDEALI